MKELIVPEAMKRSYNQFHFAPALLHDGRLYCSGQIGTGADGDIPSDVKDEFRNAFTAIEIILQEAGFSFVDVIEMTTYHTDMPQSLGQFMEVKDEFIAEPYPAWTAIGATALAVPRARVEIKVIAGK